MRVTRRGFLGMLAAAVPFSGAIFARRRDEAVVASVVRNDGPESILALCQSKMDAASAEMDRTLRRVMFDDPVIMAPPDPALMAEWDLVVKETMKKFDSRYQTYGSVIRL